MGIKSIVLVVSGTDEDTASLTATAKLCKRTGSHVEVIPAFPDPAADLVFYGTAMGAGAQAVSARRIAEAEREAQERIVALARDIAQQEGLRWGSDGRSAAISVDQRALSPALALATAGVLADLVVFGGRAAREVSLTGALFAETLLTTRAPVLLAKDKDLDFSRVAVAWDGSAQSARAVRAAMPLLRDADEVLILHNTEDEAADIEAAKPERLELALARRGVLNVTSRTLSGSRVAESLLEGARAAKCGLLVAGGYGRPRLFELVLGGTTRALVREELPPHILLAH